MDAVRQKKISGHKKIQICYYYCLYYISDQKIMKTLETQRYNLVLKKKKKVTFKDNEHEDLDPLAGLGL